MTRSASETVEETDGPDGSLEGIWTVDPTIGSFDYAADDFSGSYAGYRVQEELAQIGSNTAVGRTPDVTGEITIEGEQLIAADFEVDMTTLVSDEGFRDNALTTRGLETNTYPTASFGLTEPLTLSPDAGSGEQLAFTAIGELTLHGETNEIAVELDAELDGDAIAVVGSAPVMMADYGIDPPTAPVVVSVRDEGTFEFQIFLTRS